ncbi:S1/P1 Nuclease [Anatilimnocola aggregata]|uniref:S1/P1 Nuclease n=1 Tax=Anatilimnocola aggregata TaxID=2528021 RepID=A0A517Y4S6_9BACT|nr:S1/P1 nuclease [Anatilimnocola aggregata]QDU25248.1 S1/P1 Nuclease [Anatilimnocola aggregata]
MRKAITALLIVLLLVGPTYAWNDLGHKIVAAVAWRQLNNNERDRVIALLKNHPRFAEDFKAKMPAAVANGTLAAHNEWLIQQAAIWPDIARGILPETVRENFHRPTWHYINKPLFLVPADEATLHGDDELNLKLDPPAVERRDMNVVQTIRLARRTLGSMEAAKQKALMLSWLTHSVGDLHQPMHSTAFFTKNLFPAGDRGGNLIRTEQRFNLHSLWDSFPGSGGPGATTFREARNFSFVMTNDDEFKTLGTAAAGDLNEETWLAESFELAKNVAYGPEILGPLRIFEADNDPEYPPIKLSEDYLEAGGSAVDRRLIQAGYRLGAILKKVAVDNP